MTAPSPENERSRKPEMITFKTDHLGHPVTESGKPVTCDGCGTVLTEQPGPDQQAPVPDDLAHDVYGKEPGVLTYIVCPRGAECLHLAQHADEMYDKARCRISGCNGDHCDAAATAGSRA
jgi:hypothetical protein